MRVPLVLLMLSALSNPALAGEASIVETDEGITVEYSGDATDKTAEKPATGQASPFGSAPEARAANQDASQPTERPARVRDQSRKDRAPRSSGGEGE